MTFETTQPPEARALLVQRFELRTTLSTKPYLDLERSGCWS